MLLNKAQETKLADYIRRTGCIDVGKFGIDCNIGPIDDRCGIRVVTLSHIKKAKQGGKVFGNTVGHCMTHHTHFEKKPIHIRISEGYLKHAVEKSQNWLDEGRPSWPENFHAC